MAAFDGGYHFVVWDRNVGSRVSQSGQVLSPIRFDGLGGCEAIVSQGSECTIAWAASRHIHGARIRTSGQVLDTFIMAAQPGSQNSPVLAIAPDARTLLCYLGWAGTEGGVVYNTTRVWGKMGPFGGVAEGGSPTPRKPLSLEVSPNPAVGRSVIRYSLPMSRRVSIRLYDVSGRLARTLHQGVLEAGARKVVVNVSGLARGVYILMLTADDNRISRKLILQ
jgi:hypothetical protein